jgi:hypothetical protein
VADILTGLRGERNHDVSRTSFGTGVILALIAVATVAAIFGINVVMTSRDSSAVQTVQPTTPAPGVKSQTRTTGVPAVPVRTDRAAESDLRNALTAEITYYTDQQHYTVDPKSLREIEPSLDWGGRISVVLVDRPAATGQAVCVATVGATGNLALAEVASGPHAGTYFARQGCSRDLSVIDAWTTKGW